MLKTECQRCKYRQAGWYLSKTLQLVHVVIQVLYTALSLLCLAFYNINCICKIGGSLINCLLSMVYVKEKKRHADSGDCYCATTEAEHWTVYSYCNWRTRALPPEYCATLWWVRTNVFYCSNSLDEVLPLSETALLNFRMIVSIVIKHIFAYHKWEKSLS